ncbi:MAG TPA: PIN domain-containing protein [Parafilimonas sp.]|jgi:predicted nucleic acid-binding protein
MAYKVFLDTNIIVDFLQPVRPFHEDAKELFLNLSKDIFIAHISESVITTTPYLIRKDFSSVQLNILLQNLNQKLTILSCNNQHISTALQKQPTDFEDALLYEIALHHQMDYFVTTNTKDFKKIQQAHLPVIRAREMNKILAE